MFDDNTIDKHSPIPLYYQLKQIIINYIDNKEDGSSFPTAEEICNFYNISQTTVRTALNELVNEGYIFRQKGKGTIIQKKKKSLSEIYNNASPMLIYAPMHLRENNENYYNHKSYKIALCVKHTETIYFKKLYKSALEEFRRYNIDALCYDSYCDLEKQISDLEFLIDKQYDLIILDPCSPPKNLNKVLKKIFDSNIPVITMNSYIDKNIPYLTHIGCDNTQLGYRVGTYISSMIIKNNYTFPVDVAMLRGPKGNIAGKEREHGFLKGLYTLLKIKDINIVDKFNGDWTRDSGSAGVEQFIEKHPSTKIVFAYNDDMAIGGMQTAKRMNREDIIFATIDGSKEALESILNDDQIKVIGINDPEQIGCLTSDIAVRFLDSGTVPSKIILTEPFVVSSVNIHSYYKYFVKNPG